MSGPVQSRQELFDQVHRDYGEALNRIAACYVDQDADRLDLFQEILVAIWRALPRFEGRSSLKTFVYRIAYNRGASYRVASRRNRHSDLDMSISHPGPGPAESLQTARRRAWLRDSIRRLPMPLRQAVMLRVDGLSNQEIAQVVGISEGNVAVRLSRAKKALESLLNEDVAE